MKSARNVRNQSYMRAVIIYPWQVEEFIQWLEPDVSKWPIDDVKQAPSITRRKKISSSFTCSQRFPITTPSDGSKMVD